MRIQSHSGKPSATSNATSPPPFAQLPTHLPPDPISQVNKLATDFEKQFYSFKSPQPHSLSSPPQNSTNSIDIKLTCPTEIRKSITSLPNKKSPGHDSITFETLRNIPYKWLSPLATLFNAIITSKFFPSSWKHAIIIPVPKKIAKNSVPLVSFQHSANFSSTLF